MTIDLKAIRERVREMASNPRLSELALVDDRAQLLALVDRMRDMIRKLVRICGCPQRCSCAWKDEQAAYSLLRDLDGDARGGGR